MKSEDTKRIIREIAKEEGLSEWATTLIVMSQFEGVRDIIISAIPDHIETFKSVRLNAFGHFRVLPNRFRKFKTKAVYYEKKRLKHDSKK